MTDMTDLHAAEVEDKYTSASPEHLLEALEQAGRTPNSALLEACLDRREALIPGLLKVLEAGIGQGYDEEWDEDDPRWYREVHAGLFLIAFARKKPCPSSPIFSATKSATPCWSGSKGRSCITGLWRWIC